MVFSSSTLVAAETVRQYAVTFFPMRTLNIVKVASIRVAMMSSPPYYLGPAIHAEQQIRNQACRASFSWGMDPLPMLKTTTWRRNRESVVGPM